MSTEQVKPAIEVDNLAVSRGGDQILDALSFDLAAGSFTALVGPNGCGKTTLFETLLGLLAPRSGSLEVLGRSPAQARSRIAYVPQAGRLDHDAQFTGRDFVAAAYRGERWGMPLRRRQIRRAVDGALACVGAGHLADRRLATLSGGQRQRVLIAQALVNSPEFLFMDEPLAQLDPASADEIVALAAHLKNAHDIGVLFSTHDVNPVVDAADRVLYLANGTGRIGPVDEIVTDDVLSELYGVPMHVVRERGQVFVMRDKQARASAANTAEPAPSVRVAS